MSNNIAHANQVSANLVNMNPSLKEGACLLAVEVKGSCGEATLPKTRTVLDGNELSSELLKGTTLQWFPREHLRFVNKTVQRVSRLLSKEGVAFGRGLTMVPLAQIDEIQTELDKMKMEFSEEVDNICADFESIIDAHKVDNQEVSHLIERFKLECDTFKGRFVFKAIPPMAVQPLFEDDEEDLKNQITLTLWDEIAADAAALAKNSFVGKEKCGQRVISAINKLRRKLINLSFLDKGILKVVDSFDEALKGLPKTGDISGGEFHRLAHYVSDISEPENLKGIASGDFEADEQEAIEIETQSQPLEDSMSFNDIEETEQVESQALVALDEVQNVSSANTHTSKTITPVFGELDFGGF